MIAIIVEKENSPLTIRTATHKEHSLNAHFVVIIAMGTVYAMHITKDHILFLLCHHLVCWLENVLPVHFGLLLQTFLSLILDQAQLLLCILNQVGKFQGCLE